MKLFILLLALYAPMNISAQDICEVQDYDSEIEPDFDCPGPLEMNLVPDLRPPDSLAVEAGDTIVAPWDGALVHKDRLVQMGFHLKTLRQLRWADRVRIRAGMELVLEYHQELSAINDQHSADRVQIYKDALDRANQNISSADKWYKKFWFGYLMGIVTSGILVGLAAYVVTAL